MSALTSKLKNFSLKAVFAASVISTVLYGYKANKELSDIIAYNQNCWVKHEGKSLISVSQALSYTDHVITDEEKQILAEAKTAQGMWQHQRTMHGLMLLGLVSSMITGAALSVRKITSQANSPVCG